MSRPASARLPSPETSCWPARRPTAGRSWRGWGCRFGALPPRFDEASVSIEGNDRRARLAEALARGKADSIAATEPAATIIGCDQLVSFEGRIFGKPGTRRPRDRAARGHVGPDVTS